MNYFKIPHVVELDKAYPRDWINPGRIRIKLKSDDKTLTNPEIKNSIITLYLSIMFHNFIFYRKAITVQIGWTYTKIKI